MWLVLLLGVALTSWWITSSFRLALAVALAALIVWHDAGWALGAVIALACIASLAGWLDRFHEWFLERADRIAGH